MRRPLVSSFRAPADFFDAVRGRLGEEGGVKETGSLMESLCSGGAA